MKKTVAVSSALGLALFANMTGSALSDGRDEQGNVGATSYKTLPFMQQVYTQSWDSSPGLTPVNLFFQANKNSAFLNPSTMAAAQDAASSINQNSVIPASGAQRWDCTYASSFPAGYFKNEPAACSNDRQTFQTQSNPEYGAWRDWLLNHPQYFSFSPNGNPMPDNADWNSWGGSWGHTSPYMPLDAVDCPPDQQTCTYGDLFAYQWGLTAAKSGAFGIMLSDFTDSMPGGIMYQDFNPRVMKAFATSENARYPGLYPSNDIPGSTNYDKAKTIISRNYNHWTDYASEGYGHFFAALAKRLHDATGHDSLVIDQSGGRPLERRLAGTDPRILLTQISPRNYLAIWDNQIIQSGRGGPLVHYPLFSMSSIVLGAAREPLSRNGANLEADDSAYWGAIGQYYPGLDANTQKEIGYKILKRLWLYASWSHISDRGGNVRRALAFMSRDYWDAGSLTALDPLTSLIQTIVPTKPFGPAIYYSVGIERIKEGKVGQAAGPGNSSTNDYMSESDMVTILTSNVGAGYYVSDYGMWHMKPGTDAVPSAWIVVDKDGLLPQNEKNALSALAPIVSSAAEAAAMPGAPLSFSSGLAGFGFYDQNKRLIVVVNNSSVDPSAGDVSGSINVNGLADGTYTLKDLFSNATSQVQVTNGAVNIPTYLSRWDTLAFSLSH